MQNGHEKSGTALLAPEARLSPSSCVEPLPAGLAAASASSEEASAPAARIYRHPVAIAISFGLAALALLLFGIKTPTNMFYDEGYFVPEAKVFILGPNPNSHAQQEKPPLGKLLLSIGVRAAGDNALGWRVAAAVCGALALVAIFLWTYLLLQDTRLACLAAGLTVFNNFWFVMSRIGMMDAFLMVFLTWSLAAFTASLVLDVGIRQRRFLFCSSGVLIGLAGACKWNAIDTVAVFFLVTFALWWIARHPMEAADSSLSVCADRVQQIGIPILLLGLIVAPIASYSLTYWPLCQAIHRPFNIGELVAMHKSIWHFNSSTTWNRAIISPWYSWPFNLGPQRALSYLVGNPVVAWGGLAAMAVCLRRFWKEVSLQEGLLFLLFAANYLQWAVTPEKGLFYYYYYPSVMILGVTIAVSLRSLPTRVFGVRISLLLLMAAGTYFLRCYPQMMHSEAPWDCAFGCWP
jgi:dolichyl-phosphate-mannose--protein O-mannosyl transferase